MCQSPKTSKFLQILAKFANGNYVVTCNFLALRCEKNYGTRQRANFLQ